MSRIFLFLIGLLSVNLQAAHHVQRKVQAEEKIHVQERHCFLRHGMGGLAYDSQPGLSTSGIALLVTDFGATRHDIYAQNQTDGRAYQYLSFEQIFERKNRKCKASTLSEDGNLIACSDDKGVVFTAQYDRQSRQLKVVGKIKLEKDEYAARLMFTPDSKQLIVLAIKNKFALFQGNYSARVIIFDSRLTSKREIRLVKKCDYPNFDLAIDHAGKRIAVAWAGDAMIAGLQDDTFVKYSPDWIICNSVLFGEGGSFFIGHPVKSGSVPKKSIICFYDDARQRGVQITSLPFPYISKTFVGEHNELYIFVGSDESSFKTKVCDVEGRVRFEFADSWWFGPLAVTKDGKNIVAYRQEDQQGKHKYTILSIGKEIPAAHNEPVPVPAAPPAHEQATTQPDRATPSEPALPSYDEIEAIRQKLSAQKHEESLDKPEKNQIVASRKKYILRGIAGVVAVLAAYAAYKKLKKNKKVVTFWNAVRKKRAAIA